MTRLELECNAAVAGDMLRQLRLEQGLSLRVLGERIGTTHGGVHNREVEGLCTLRTVEDYFNALGYEVTLVLTKKG